ncbi:cyclic nucleotide-binding domain-containing protein [Niastella caeni]|uniref:Cyclic nucleotide-binding domain-containing protein n=1 Tax=Niastella caeni TaxID=2569763 RepID=A0A4S8HLD9_9BACT|nr:cyclic nucleotide-binding domain-containing protein [Niastella caeni]THU36027.1 cyclic nucleotide-binding domain-containing protein [Niastella caeni]
MKTLKDHIERTISVTDNELEHMVHSFQSMTLGKESHLIKAGQYCDNYYFVETGSLRIYTMVDNMVVTNWFVFEGNFFTDLESYTYQCQAKFNIQAIENCTILYISRKNMNELLAKYPAWSELVRKTWEQAFIRLAQIVLSVQTLSAQKRYEHLLNHHEFIQNTPAKDLLASLLGITDSSLSKK